MIGQPPLDDTLQAINTEVYFNCKLTLTNYEVESEGSEYKACHFKLNTLSIICRNAKVTPKKAGLFVTFWKRNAEKITEPFSDTDNIDFFVINTLSDSHFGQFVFPKSALLSKGIISSANKEGKRGFRVYPPHVKLTSKLALKTQKWQSAFYLSLEKPINLARAEALYQQS